PGPGVTRISNRLSPFTSARATLAPEVTPAGSAGNADRRAEVMPLNTLILPRVPAPPTTISGRPSPFTSPAATDTEPTALLNATKLETKPVIVKAVPSELNTRTKPLPALTVTISSRPSRLKSAAHTWTSPLKPGYARKSVSSVPSAPL